MAKFGADKYKGYELDEYYDEINQDLLEEEAIRYEQEQEYLEEFREYEN